MAATNEANAYTTFDAFAFANISKAYFPGVDQASW